MEVVGHNLLNDDNKNTLNCFVFSNLVMNVVNGLVGVFIVPNTISLILLS